MYGAIFAFFVQIFANMRSPIYLNCFQHVSSLWKRLQVVQLSFSRHNMHRTAYVKLQMFDRLVSTHKMLSVMLRSCSEEETASPRGLVDSHMLIAKCVQLLLNLKFIIHLNSQFIIKLLPSVSKLNYLFQLNVFL